MRAALAVVAVALFVSSPALAAKLDLSGEVTYRERIALPPAASLEIQLIDQTLPGAPPRLDVQAPIGAGQVPLSFALSFDDTLVIPGHSYALIASISDASGLLFRNFEPYAVDPLAPAESMVIVTNLVGQLNDGASSSAEPQPPAPPAILDSTWVAYEIAGAAVLPRTTPSLLIGGDMRAGGSTGCNSWFAQAMLDGDTVRFGSATTTLRACGQSVNLQEQAFKDAIAAVMRWQVEGDDLTLFGADGKALLKLGR